MQAISREEANMTQPAVADSTDWERRWTIDAASVLLRPVTRRLAHAVLDGGPITSTFEEGALHDRIPQAMGVAIWLPGACSNARDSTSRVRFRA
jgi:hypothetical protein